MGNQHLDIFGNVFIPFLIHENVVKDTQITFIYQYISNNTEYSVNSLNYPLITLIRGYLTLGCVRQFLHLIRSVWKHTQACIDCFPSSIRSKVMFDYVFFCTFGGWGGQKRGLRGSKNWTQIFSVKSTPN